MTASSRCWISGWPRRWIRCSPTRRPRSSPHSPTFTATRHTGGHDPRHGGVHEPGQAKGKPVDKRADIWAFGVVLYEMLAGRLMFSRENVTETLRTGDPEGAGLEGAAAGCPAARARPAGALSRQRIHASAFATSAMRALPSTRRFRSESSGITARSGMGESRIATPRTRVRCARVRIHGDDGGRARMVGPRGGAGNAADESGSKIVPPSGTRPQPEVPKRWIEMSPDGRHLAFTGTPASPGIFVRSLDTPACACSCRPSCLAHSRSRSSGRRTASRSRSSPIANSTRCTPAAARRE